MSESQELLLFRVEAGSATPADLAELERWMQTPEGRKQVVDHLMFNAVLRETLEIGAEQGTSTSARREVQKFHEEQDTGVTKSTAKKSKRSTRRRRPLPLTRSNPFTPIFTIVALFALVVAGFVLYRQMRTPEVTAPVHVAMLEQYFGDVAEVSGMRRLVTTGMDLNEGQTLETGVNSQATLVYADGTTIHLAPSTRLTNLGIKAGKQGRLERGRIDAEVAPQPQGAPMVLQTPQAAVTVVGTEFSLDVNTSTTRLDVDHGKVRMARSTDNAAVDVSAKEYAIAGPNVALEVKSTTPPPATERTITLLPIADTYVQGGKETAKNFGTADILAIKNDGGKYPRESFLRFDLSSVRGRITQARLKLFVFSMDNTTKYTHTIALLKDATWQENEMTWNNRPTGGQPLASWTPQPGGLKVDLTSALTPEMLKLPRWDFKIYAPNVEDDKSWVFYTSRESKRAPALTLTVLSE